MPLLNDFLHFCVVLTVMKNLVNNLLLFTALLPWETMSKVFFLLGYAGPSFTPRRKSFISSAGSTNLLPPLLPLIW